MSTSIARVPRFRYCYCTSMLLLAALGCAPNPSQSQGVAAGPTPTPADTSLFAAVVRSLEARVDSLAPEPRVLWVNPRPLQPDPALTWVHDDDFASGEEQSIQSRSEILQRLGVRAFRTFPEDACSHGGGGLAPWGVSPQPTKPGPHPLCAYVALSRPGGVHYPPEDIDESQAGLESGRRTTRVMLRFSHAMLLYDIVAEPAKAGLGWNILEWREVFGAMS